MKQVYKIIKERPFNIMVGSQDYILLDNKGEGETLSVFEDVEANSGDWFCMFGEGPAGSSFLLVKDESTEKEEHYLITDQESYYRLHILPGEVILDEMPADYKPEP